MGDTFWSRGRWIQEVRAMVDQVFQPFFEASPVSVMFRATLGAS